MFRSIPTISSSTRNRVLFILLIVVLTMNNIDQTQGLVVAGGCGDSIWGKRISSNSNSNSMMGTTIMIQNNHNSNELLITTPQQTIVPSTTTSTTTTADIITEKLALSSSSLLTFNFDVYRQEMIDFVYARNLQRCL
mmetsp:Transcript_7956/g.9128  ORF Transcript_7956/g.9128 Transcript_7956/m.9128 type:complete len:137 (-) Transcript_7956:172-582(-)